MKAVKSRIFLPVENSKPYWETGFYHAMLAWYMLSSCVRLSVCPPLLKLYTQLTDMGKHVSLCWIPCHVGIKGNETADKAAKDGICSIITQSKIPPESFFPHISKLCMEEWQDSWDSIPTNKLFSIKPVLGKNKPCTSLCHLDETVITRLRIGHSRMTHCWERESTRVWSLQVLQFYVINSLAVPHWKSCSPMSMHAASLILPRRAAFTEPSK